MAQPPNDLAVALARVRERIDAAARRAGRDPAEVELVAVTKTQPPEVVAAAVRAGVRHVGENRVQEAAGKLPRATALLQQAGLAPPTWRFVGHLQTNKVGASLALFDSVDSVDSVRLAEALDRRIREAVPARSPLPILLEVYMGDDPTRPGFRPHEIDAAMEVVGALPGLHVQGLMTVAPLGWSERETRGAFRRVRELRDRLTMAYPRVDLRELSMGMTDDFELAVEEGSTMVRIGRALFGPRGMR